MRIAVDVDGVILKTHELFVKKFNTNYGTNHTINDITSWNIWECFNCEKEEVMNTFNELAYVNWDELGLHGFPGFYMQVMNITDHVDVLTNRIPNTLEKTITKLDQSYISRGRQYEEFIDTEGICKTLYDYDVFVDDNPNMIKTLKSNQKLILFEQSWNQRVIITEKVHRARDWGEVFKKYVRIKNSEAVL